MKYIYFGAVLLLAACSTKQKKNELPDYNDALLQQVRNAAITIPGKMPTAIRYQQYASTARTWKDLIEDGSNDPAMMDRTAFKIQFGDDFIMVDAGMDRQVHHFFEKDGPQPFDDSLAAKVSTSLFQAKLILITHEHGDHVANVIRLTDNNIAAKTILTKEQADVLMNNPQMPEIKLTPEKRKAFIIASFETVLPVAPGVVLIKAPGHTKGEIMVYTKLENGREFIFCGDVSWTYKGVAENKQKPSSERKRVGEDADDITQELTWLHDRLVKDKINILVSHDNIMLPQMAAAGIIQSGF